MAGRALDPEPYYTPIMENISEAQDYESTTLKKALSKMSLLKT
ncbi:MAG: hypothetical protein QXZ70_05895 [Candidatus Bathyarchaeia archaeon]